MIRPLVGWATRAAVVATIAVLGVGAADAGAQSNTEAEVFEKGLPAAAAPAFSEDADGFVYKGKAVSDEFIQANELACLAVDKGPSRCYDSPEATEAAEVGSRAQASKRVLARKAACGTISLLTIWNGADYTGGAAQLDDRNRWANLGGAYNDEGSSFHMGDFAGHLAEHADGAGYWYPGNTGACAVENNLNLNGSGWNNRISSRKRL